MRNRGVLLLALAIAAVLAAGSAVALINAGDDNGPLITSLPTATPTASETPSPTPSPTESATPTPTPTATQSATAEPTATRSATSQPTSGTHTYAYPKPSHAYDGLQMTITSNPANGTVGQTFTLSAVATDGDGTIFFNGMSWGDGSDIPGQASPQHCKSYPPLTSPPGPYQPQPDRKTYEFKHKYLAPGDYVITFRVASVNADCRPNGPKREDRVLSLTVHVKAA